MGNINSNLVEYYRFQEEKGINQSVLLFLQRITAKAKELHNRMRFKKKMKYYKKK